MNEGKILRGKTIVVTGCASGIGLETARVIKLLGGQVIGVDINQCDHHVDEFHQADLSDKAAIEALVDNLPKGSHGIANIAGLPPTRPPVAVLKVNLVGLKHFTELMVPGLADGAAIVNLASLAGSGWRQSLAEIRATAELDFEGVADFVSRHGVGSEGGRCYFFSKEALVVWTMQNRWTWRSRGIRMNAVSPGPVETPILPDFLATLGARAEEDMRIMDRPGRPEDVAPVVAFLLSDMSAWIRGANIPCDGGMASHLLCEGVAQGHVP
jgi:NAD(P)-dependent dehydrogenase (short-subunit alcohol dehydrogenase family)|tara:strand:+ start:95 stop:901 length:807 start_codon:yes stop_codon:yes gene_type:complete